MERFFNIAGMCRPEDHYMVEPEGRLARLRPLIDRKAWFVIHAPRQSGKTTTTGLLAETLTREGRYAAVLASCKPGSTAGDNVERGIGAVVTSLSLDAQSQLPVELRPPSLQDFRGIDAEGRLRGYLQAWCERCPRPVVLFLDEIDALMGDTLLSVLDQLHAAYPSLPGGSPHALALIGLREVRDYKLARDGSRRVGSSSPFNIKSHSLTLRNFTADQVSDLYSQHTEDTGQAFSEEARVRAWELTQGQPWLTNALAAVLVDELITDRTQEIGVADIEVAKEVLIRRRDTHLDSLVERLKEKRVRNIVDAVLTGELPKFEVSNDDLDFVKDLGIVAPCDDGLKITSPIYREIITRLPHFTGASDHCSPALTVDSAALTGKTALSG